MTLVHNIASSAAQYGAMAAILYVVYIFCTREYRPKNLPPGPTRLPFFGNALQLPRVNQHLAMQKWFLQYGDIIYAEFFGSPAIIISSAKVAMELVEKRGAKYSDRPAFSYFNELVGWTGNTAFKAYSDNWKRTRKWYQQGFIARSAVRSYHPIQRREVRKLLREFVQDPGVSDFTLKLKRYAAAIIFEVGYGHTVSSTDDDDFMRPVEEGVRICLMGSSTGSALYDFLPMLRHIPEWVPGMQFKRVAKVAKKAIQDMENIPYSAVMHAVDTGTARPSFTSRMIEECAKDGVLSEQDASDVKGAAGTLYAAGTDTSLTSLLTFTLAMVQHPDVLKKAQDEMFKVIGDARLPDFDDRASLPYLECIIREVYRWCPSVSALPHQSTEDDTYRGYYIPKGSSVIINFWAIFRDPNIYPEPDAFLPDRFLGLSESPEWYLTDPKKIVFGFGRRICPGRFFADDNVWLAAASIVATMDISKARDESGEEIEVNPEITSGTILRPAPFVCDIRPRSSKSIQLILNETASD